jgi:hypothetical protein
MMCFARVRGAERNVFSLCSLCVLCVSAVNLLAFSFITLLLLYNDACRGIELKFAI